MDGGTRCFPVSLTVMGGTAIERTYSASADRVWDALWHTIAELRYHDVKADIEGWTIEYRTGFSVRDWRGQQMTAVVHGHGDATAISLTGHSASRQLISWGEENRLAKKVLDRVERRLST
jgi:hypothetical protein